MWNSLRNWIHHFLNPHCLECQNNIFLQKQCNNCEVLRYLLEREKAEKLRLIEFITYREVPKDEPEGKLPKPLYQMARPWRVVAAELEANSRLEAERRKQAAENSKEVSSISSLEELEKKAGVAENG